MNKEDIKIFVTYKDKHKIIETDIIKPIQTGRAIATEIFDEMIGDDTGDNISAENPKYNELSAQYWVWKNYEKIGNPAYVGFMHYRRHFAFCQDFKTKHTWLKNSNISIIEEMTNEYINTNFNNKNIISAIENNDILTIKKYNVRNLKVKSCKEEYLNIVPFSHKEIFDILLESICNLYPDYIDEVEKFKTSNEKYLCNMFIMNRKVFFAYSEFLFNVLKEINSKIDTITFCEQEMRFLGYMGEFLLTIFINQNKNKLKIKELAGYYINNDNETTELKPIFKDNFTTIAMSSSDEYAPYLTVCLQSLIDNSSNDKNYDIIILEKNISDQNKKLISQLAIEPNISIRFYNCTNIIQNKANIDKKTHYREECIYRLYAADIFKNYSKIIFTDCDLLFLKDISLLETTNIENYPVAACQDYMMNAMYNIDWADWRKYCKNDLKLKNIYSYCNTGVMIINTNLFKKQDIRSKCIDLLENSHLRILEQDALNAVLQDNIKYIPYVWNIMTLQEQMRYWHFLDCMSLNVKKEYLAARKNIHILHYAATRKPWFYPEEEFADIWWQYARKTPFYEIILKRMCDKNKTSIDLLKDVKHYKSNILKYWKYKILQNFVFGKTRKRYTNKKQIFKAKIRHAKGIV